MPSSGRSVILIFFVLVSSSQTFTPPSFIKYQLKETFLKTYNPLHTTVEMMVRTRDRDGGVLFLIYDKNRLERLEIRVSDTIDA